MDYIPPQDAEDATESEIEELKLKCKVYQESGVIPATISVVLPTFNNGSDEYISTMVGVLRKISKLIDRGAVDELIIVDGSRDDKGLPDAEFIKFMLALCIKHCKTFNNEVNFIRSLPEGKFRAMEGRFDFSVRFLSQLDPLLHKIFLDHELLTESEIEFLKRGKGAGLWYSVPVSYGNILCFVDSDIRSFRKFYISSLVKPILESWDFEDKSPKCKSGIVFTKAVYHRENSGKEKRFGGRLERMGGRPLFNALAKNDAFKGLEDIRYHMSGECAFTIDALKSIQFSNGYDIETSILCQLWEQFGMSRIAQVDLGTYIHIPGDEDHVMDMMSEVSSALRYWCKKYKIDVDIEKLSKDYEIEAEKLLDVYAGDAKRLDKYVYGAHERFEDEARIPKFKEILKREWEIARMPKLLHSWKDIEDSANMLNDYSYMNLKTSLRKRINKFTSNMILSSIYIDRKDDIINKYMHSSD
jgi:glycosyltransferase involved in cell wall biosynthesis